MNLTRMAITGTPSEIGAEVFARIVVPCVVEMASAGPLELAQFYGGFLGAAAGALRADFQQDVAEAILSQVLKTLQSDGPLMDAHAGADGRPH